jgi:hypothetical protein
MNQGFCSFRFRCAALSGSSGAALNLTDEVCMKVWITRYALTLGILAKEAEQVSPTMIKAGRNCFFMGPDWHVSEDSAKHQAERMRVAKIASVEKQLAKLRAMVF